MLAVHTRRILFRFSDLLELHHHKKERHVSHPQRVVLACSGVREHLLGAK